MIKVLLAPLTRTNIYDYLIQWKDKISNVFSEIGVNLRIDIWPTTIKPSMKCFNWKRTQYESLCIIKQLFEVFKDYVMNNDFFVLGVGYIDAYTEPYNFLFGQAAPQYSIAIVYTKRLNPIFYGDPPDYNLYSSRVVKELFHELGHLLGLSHCFNDNCVMRFSNNVLEVDYKEARFCKTCVNKIRNYISSTK